MIWSFEGQSGKVQNFEHNWFELVMLLKCAEITKTKGFSWAPCAALRGN